MVYKIMWNRISYLSIFYSYLSRRKMRCYGSGNEMPTYYGTRI